MTAPTDPYGPAAAERRAAMWPDTDRLSTAFALARDVATCEALLRGDHVDPNRLDQDWLTWARKQKFVQLASPAELLGVS
jgi:hypothetical protein